MLNKAEKMSSNLPSVTSVFAPTPPPRLIDFVAGKNLAISGTKFQHKASTSLFGYPDQSTNNQFDHLVIDGRHLFSVMDVCVIRGAKIDSDYFLVDANKTGLWKAETNRGSHNLLKKTHTNTGAEPTSP